MPYQGKVNRHVWHVSFKENRDAIRRKGLQPQSFEKSAWNKHKDLHYPSAIFVNNHESYADWFYLEHSRWIPTSLGRFDIWRIDASRLDNSWYIDQNLQQDGTCLYTKEPIPSSALRLYQMEDIACAECHTIIDGLPLSEALWSVENRKKQSLKYLHEGCLVSLASGLPDAADWFLRKGQVNINKNILYEHGIVEEGPIRLR